MKFNVHFKNEHARDDSITVAAVDELAAECLAMDLRPGAVDVIGAYPAESPAAEEEGWVR